MNLEQIPNENGVVPQRFPPTVNHIRDMSGLYTNEISKNLNHLLN